MDRGWYLRFSAVLAAAVISWLALWPSLGGLGLEAPKWVRDVFPGRISPGLDIRGGLRLMYEVEVDEYIRDQRDRKAERLLRQVGVLLGLYEEDQMDNLSEAKLAELREKVSVERLGDATGIRVTFSNPADASKLTRDWLRDTTGNTLRLSGGAHDGVVNLRLREEVVEEWRDSAVSQAVHTVHNRIDTLGVREATVSGRESDIIVEVPGADESSFDRIRSIISRTARLEFKVVADGEPFPATPSLPQGIERTSERAPAGESQPDVESEFLVARGPDSLQQLKDYIATLHVPEGRQIVVGRMDGSTEQEPVWRTWYLIDHTDVTGEDIQDAFVSFDQSNGNRPVVSLQFKSEGAAEFEAMTGANVKRRMAIDLDDRVESAPVIQARIGGGHAQITLGSYQDYQSLLNEARDLVVVLKAGALPAPLRPSNEQLIGPSLGRDSIKLGIEGAVAGVGLVLAFMAFYYQVAGVVADAMVLLNLLMQLAIMAAFEATLTLPGFAAMALTVGMAVDANVLITERIREELRLGKSARSSVDLGFDRAFWSILDGQLTTLIAGIVLFQYGTGPIKGFAVMLMIGIVTSLFTGIFCSKMCLDWIVRGLRVQRLRVG
jgi:preprotein translocase subunit SecD